MAKEALDIYLPGLLLNRPGNLVLRGRGREILIEAKILYQGNAAQAVRSAIGQLMEYRLWEGKTSPVSETGQAASHSYS